MSEGVPLDQAPSTEAPKTEPAVVITEAPVVIPAAVDVPEAAAPSTVLGEALKAQDAPKEPVEAPKTEEVKIEDKDGGQSAEPAPLPTYDAFILPDGVSMDNERMSDFTTALAEFERTSKADHAEVQKLGQDLVNKHVAMVQDAVQRLQEHNFTAFEKQKTEWKDAFVGDPEIGGNKQQTTVNAALEFIRTHGGTSEQQADFHNLMETTGVGNHPAMIRILSNAMDKMREGQPVPAKSPLPSVKNKIEKRYGSL